LRNSAGNKNFSIEKCERSERIVFMALVYRGIANVSLHRNWRFGNSQFSFSVVF